MARERDGPSAKGKPRHLKTKRKERMYWLGREKGSLICNGWDRKV